MRKPIKQIVAVAFSTFGSRLLGLVRDVLTFATLGTGLYGSVFVFAFRLPNLFRRLLGEGALSSALIPVFTDTLNGNKGKKELFRILNLVLSRLIPLLIIIIITGCCVLFIIEQSSTLQRWKTGSQYGRLLFPYILFICIAATLTSALNVLQKFIITSLSPIWLNLCMIFPLFYGYLQDDLSLDRQLFYLCLGVLIGGLIQLMAPMLELFAQGWRPKISFRKDRELHKIYHLFLPGLSGAAILQVNALISGIFAHSINESSSSIIYIANRVVELPLGIFTIAISTVLFPMLAKYASNNSQKDFKETFKQGTLLILIMNCPALIGLILLNHEIIQLLFEWKEMTSEDTLVIAPILSIYALSLPFYSMTSFITKGFHSMKNMKTPMNAAFWALLLNITFSFIFIHFWGIQGLAIAALLTYSIQTLYLFTRFYEQISFTWDSHFVKDLFKIIIACGALGLFCYFGSRFQFPILFSERIDHAIHTLGLIMLSGALYFIILLALNLNPLKLIKKNA